MLVNVLIWFKRGVEGKGAFAGEAVLFDITQKRLQEILGENDPDELLNGSFPLNSKQVAELANATTVNIDVDLYDYLFEIRHG